MPVHIVREVEDECDLVWFFEFDGGVGSLETKDTGIGIGAVCYGRSFLDGCEYTYGMEWICGRSGNRRRGMYEYGGWGRAAASGENNCRCDWFRRRILFPGIRHLSILGTESGAFMLRFVVEQFLGNGGCGVGILQKSTDKKDASTISAVCMAGSGSLDGSYTVEMSVVMAVILLTSAVLIQTAYRQCRQATGMMRMHHMVEVLRHGEEDSPDTLTVGGSAYRIEAERSGSEVDGILEGDGWSRAIRQSVYEPEAFMRMLTLIEE